MDNYKKYLDPINISSVQNLELRARLVVEGFITGLHKSPYHGFSVEFSEHRSYQPGDELRYIDWKVFGRTNKFYVKQFEEETNLRCTIAVDSSASMAYSSKGHIPKYEYAIYLASALAFMMNKQRDAVGLSVYNKDIVKYLPSRSKQSYVAQLIKALDEIKPSDTTGTAESLNILAERIKRRGLVIVISDFFDDIDSIIQGLRHFRHKGHEVLVFHTLDPREIDFKLGPSATFVDMESGDELLTNPHQLQKAYSEAVQNFISKFKELCYNNNIDYHLTLTNEPFDKTLLSFLTKRNKI